MTSLIARELSRRHFPELFSLSVARGLRRRCPPGPRCSRYKTMSGPRAARCGIFGRAARAAPGRLEEADLAGAIGASAMPTVARPHPVRAELELAGLGPPCCRPFLSTRSCGSQERSPRLPGTPPLSVTVRLHAYRPALPLRCRYYGRVFGRAAEPPTPAASDWHTMRDR